MTQKFAAVGDRDASREAILEAALRVAADKGYTRMARSQIADLAGVSHGLVSYHFGGMEPLRNAVMEAAVTRKILKVIRQGIANNHPIAQSAPPELIRAALS